MPVNTEATLGQGSRDPDNLCPSLMLPPQLDEGPMGEPEGSFVDYQTTMVRTAKAIAVTVQEMVSLGEFKRTSLGELSLDITSPFPLLPGNQVKHQP